MLHAVKKKRAPLTPLRNMTRVSKHGSGPSANDVITQPGLRGLAQAHFCACPSFEWGGTRPKDVRENRSAVFCWRPIEWNESKSSFLGFFFSFKTNVPGGNSKYSLVVLYCIIGLPCCCCCCCLSCGRTTDGRQRRPRLQKRIDAGSYTTDNRREA